MTAPSGAGSSSIHIIMAYAIDLAMRAKNYEKQPKGEPSTHIDSPSLPQSNGPLTFKKTTFEAPPRPSKGTLRCTHNLNMQAAQYYSIVKDLAQAPCAMSTLEVLQSCLPKGKLCSKPLAFFIPPMQVCYTLILKIVSYGSHTL